MTLSPIQTINKNGNKEWRDDLGRLHNKSGPAFEHMQGIKEWWVDGSFLGYNDIGFWALWDTLTPEQKEDPVLLSYLPEKF